MTDKAASKIGEAVDTAKAEADPDTVEKIESALGALTGTVEGLSAELDVKENLKKALTAAGTLSSDAIDKALAYGELAWGGEGHTQVAHLTAHPHTAEQEGLADKATAKV